VRLLLVDDEDVQGTKQQVVHAETSTGALQPMAQLGDIANRHSALLPLDTVTSLGGIPVEIDNWGVDVAYSGTQKCLSCQPGLSPLSISERARKVLRTRQSKVANWYLDLSMIEGHWGDARSYHHTTPISMNIALRKALRLIHEERFASPFRPAPRQCRTVMGWVAGTRP